VGKTALALKLAEELTPNFRDAQIYLDLRGVSDKPLTPAEAMAYVIRSFHPEAKLPEKEDELGGVYRSALHGKCALLLMDNAKDAAQMKPLIPPPGCALLVTSRLHFTLPGLQAKNLDTLPPPDAKSLLLHIALRIDGEAETIAKLCGYLPQALRLAASALAERVDLAPTDYAKRLADEKSRLKLLGEGDESMTASINLSYGLLDSETQRRWRMLAVFPDTFDVSAAAAMWKMERSAAEGALSHLVQHSMLEWNDAAKRYRLHDLMRDFASARLEPSEGNDAALRHAGHYMAALRKADELYLKGGESVMRGLALFDLEWGNIQAGQAWAAAHAAESPEAARLSNDYPDAGVYCLALRRRPRERIQWLETGLLAARHLKDREGEAYHLGNLGIAYKNLGETHRAIDYYEQQLTIVSEIGNRRGESNALGNLGNAYRDLGETRRAIEHYEQVLLIAREIGDRRSEGGALGNLGNAYRGMGETRRAIEHYEQFLLIAREIGDRRSEGGALGNLGNAYADLGETRRAIEYYEKQLAVAREIGDRRGEGTTLWNMSLVLDKLGQRDKAVEHAEAALKIFEEIEDPGAEQVKKGLEQWKGH
jgi:tetratricopeptide (TPR) repeat protein